MRPLAAVLLSLSICASASAQVSEVIEVRVTNVDVVVTDRAGKPIAGLTKDDFQLFENGKLQPITNFYEIRANAAPAASTAPDVTREAVIPAEARRRSILIFIDNTSIHPFRRNQAIEAVRRGLDLLLRPGDDAMIASWNRNFDVVQPFTADRAALDDAIGRVEKRMAGGASLESQKSIVISYARACIQTSRSSDGLYPMSSAYADSVLSWRTYSDMIRATQQNLFGGIGSMLATMAGMKNKKVFIFIGGQMQEHPGADVMHTIDGLFQNVGYVPIAPASLTETGRNIMGEELRRISHLANADGVTMYLIDVSEHARDATEGNLPNLTAEFMAESETKLSMGQIAMATGGSVLSGTRNFDVALDNVARDLGSYYSLGYKPSADGPSDRQLSVKVRKPGAVVRSRSGYSIKTADEQMKEDVVANVFHEGAKSDFDVTVETGKPVPFEKNFKVPVTISFSAELTFIPEGENFTGEYTVFFVIAGPDGAVSQVSKKVQAVKFPAAAYFSIMEKPFTHTATLVVRPGKQSLSVAVVDKLGGTTGYGKATIDAQ